jgi:hypothetical protein
MYCLLYGFNILLFCIFLYCMNTKRDWLICGHVALDKCNVSRRATSEKFSAPDLPILATKERSIYHTHAGWRHAYILSPGIHENKL